MPLPGRPCSLRGWRLCALGLLASALVATSPRAENEFPPAYSYLGSRLSLLIDAPESSKTAIEWRAVSESGSPVGTRRSQSIDLKAGDNKLELLVGDAGGHQLRYRIGRRTYRIWANRGVWYHTPKSIHLNRTLRTRSQAPSVAGSADLHLAGGVRIDVLSGADSPLEIGRTLGYDADYGVRVSASQALTLVARGSVRAVVFTVAQRTGPRSTEYWDIPLVLDDQLTRYVIPLRRLLPRISQSPGPLRSIYAISLRTLTPPGPGTNLEVDHIGLIPTPPQVASVRRNPRGVEITVAAHTPGGPARIWFDRPGAPPRSLSVIGRGSALVTDAEARRFWLCYGAEDEPKGCDPPDAPATTYPLPAAPGQPLLIDGFETEAPLNTARTPTLLFASSIALQQAMTVTRSGGSLRFGYHPETSGDYAGYQTPLPALMPAGLRTLELTLRGQVAADAVTVGLKDAAGREPRVRLRAYLDQLTPSWQTVRIPLEAFQGVLAGLGSGGPTRLGRLRALSVTMGVSSRPSVHELELRQIRFLPEQTPVSIMRFDGERPYQTALGAGLALESRLGAKLDGRLEAPGKHGQALSAEVTGVGDKGYALVSLGLGRIDATGYSALALWVRGESGGEGVTLYLGDGKRRAKLELGQHLTVTPQWQRAVLPFSLFQGRVNHRELRQVILAWEERDITRERLFFDELVLE